MGRRFLPLCVVQVVLLAASLGACGSSATHRAARSQQPRFAPIAVDAANPHYLDFRGRPAVLITSGEHYGGVIDPDFNYLTYLDTLARDGLNLTRVFSGSMVEFSASAPGSGHTDALAPGPTRALAPWARSTTPGAFDQGDKFDLAAWDPAYFSRLHDFVAAASERGIAVELTLFGNYYNEELWHASPLNAQNNINDVGTLPWSAADTGTDPRLLAVQKAMVRKIVGALRGFDNVYFEVINEPYTPGSNTAGWQRQIVGAIRQADGPPPGRHLIAENVTGVPRSIDPRVSLLNFHWIQQAPAGSTQRRYALGRVIADDETGVRGTDPAPYRQEAWQFMLSGGGVFDNLDRSFTVEHPEGTATIPAALENSGGPTLRRQLGILRRFVEGFDFSHMQPSSSVIDGGLAADAHAYTLAEPGTAYAIYLDRATSPLVLHLPRGRYRAKWTSPLTGSMLGDASVAAGSGRVSLTPPSGAGEIALALTRQR